MTARQEVRIFPDISVIPTFNQNTLVHTYWRFTHPQSQTNYKCFSHLLVLCPPSLLLRSLPSTETRCEFWKSCCVIVVCTAAAWPGRRGPQRMSCYTPAAAQPGSQPAGERGARTEAGCGHHWPRQERQEDTGRALRCRHKRPVTYCM